MEQLAQIDLQVFNFINHTLACTPLDFICVILRDKLCMGAVYIGNSRDTEPGATVTARLGQGRLTCTVTGTCEE